MDLFTTPAGTKDDSLPIAHEQWLIAQAQAGNKAAAWDLLWQYRGALQAASWRTRMANRSLTKEQIEDLESSLVLTALEVIRAFDTTRFIRLSHVLPKHLHSKTTEMTTALTVPKGVLSRWFKIWRLADQDFTAASLLAPYHGMTTNSFLAISHALEYSDSEWVTAPFNATKIAPSSETQRMAYLAMEVLSQQERAVVELAYGFRGDPSPDEEIAGILESSRGTVKSQRQRAIFKMREALKVEYPEAYLPGYTY